MRGVLEYDDLLGTTPTQRDTEPDAEKAVVSHEKFAKMGEYKDDKNIKDGNYVRCDSHEDQDAFRRARGDDEPMVVEFKLNGNWEQFNVWEVPWDKINANKDTGLNLVIDGLDLDDADKAVALARGIATMALREMRAARRLKTSAYNEYRKDSAGLESFTDMRLDDVDK